MLLRVLGLVQLSEFGHDEEGSPSIRARAGGGRAMEVSQRRKRLFGPLVQTTLLAGALVALYSGVELAGTKLSRWLQERKLIAGLQDTAPRNRRIVLEAMGKEDPGFAQPYLLEALKDPSPEVRLAAVPILANRGEDLAALIPVAAAATTDADDAVRQQAVKVLQILAARMRRGPFMVPSSAGADASTDLQHRSAIFSALRPLLADPSSEVRSGVVDALVQLGSDPEAVEALVASAADKDLGVRLTVARALLRIKGPDDPTAGRILVDVLADPEPIPERSQALQIIEGAGEGTRQKGVQAIAGLISGGDPLVVPDAIFCLSNSRLEGARPLLEKLLDDHDPSTRAAAAIGLLSIQDSNLASGMAGMLPPQGKLEPRLVAVLTEMIADKTLSQEWRMNALQRVHEVAPAMLSKATPGLLRQLGDAKLDVRHYALELLQAIIEDTRVEVPGVGEP
jgi:HEAT repeat protein